MLQQLTNLSDKELISRVRKLKDPEAEGVLLERYSHLLVAACLPHLGKGPDSSQEIVFSSLLQRLSSSLKTQTIYKANEWIHHTIKAYQGKADKNIPFYPSRESRELQQLENRVEKAASNALEQQQLVTQLRRALEQLDAEERYFLQQFYLENKTFAVLAAEKKYSIEKTRNILHQAKRRLASLLMNETYVK